MKRITALVVLGLWIVVGPGCSGGQQEQRLNGGGSSFVYPMMSKWAPEYDKAKGVKINYQSTGSGAGIQQMTAKTYDFGCTDAFMNSEQLEAAKKAGGEVVHIPLVMGAIVPAYNLDEIKEPLRFTGPVLADIFQGHIKKWNEKPIRDINPKVAADLPDKAISVVHRSDGSGSTYIFTDYLCQVSPTWEKDVGHGTSVKWPDSFVGQKGTEGVAGHIKATAGSIGYIELTYALQNDIKYGWVQNKEGEYIKPTLESVTAAAANKVDDIPDDLRYSLTNSPGKDSYPISGTTWAVIYVKQPADKGKAVVDFLRWVTHEGQEYAADLHYARLPKGLVERVDKKLDSVQVGQ